jgi:hypothetical protein
MNKVAKMHTYDLGSVVVVSDESKNIYIPCTDVYSIILRNVVDEEGYSFPAISMSYKPSNIIEFVFDSVEDRNIASIELRDAVERAYKFSLGSNHSDNTIDSEAIRIFNSGKPLYHELIAMKANVLLSKSEELLQCCIDIMNRVIELNQQ